MTNTPERNSPFLPWGTAYAIADQAIAYAKRFPLRSSFVSYSITDVPSNDQGYIEYRLNGIINLGSTAAHVRLTASVLPGETPVSRSRGHASGTYDSLDHEDARGRIASALRRAAKQATQSLRSRVEYQRQARPTTVQGDTANTATITIGSSSSTSEWNPNDG